MLNIDPNDLAPCEEFFEHPSGPHSPDLQRLLTIMRADTVDDPHVIVETQDGAFGLGTASDQRGDPVLIYEGVRFETYGEALKAMFKLRWEMLTGRPLPLGEDLALADRPRLPVIDDRLLAYADRWDVRPGEIVNFKVSTGRLAPDYRFDAARIRSAVGHPEGPGLHLTPMSTPADGDYEGRKQTTSIGSYIAFDRPCPVRLDAFSVRVNVKPTLRTGRPQALVDAWDAERETGFALRLDNGGPPQRDRWRRSRRRRHHRDGKAVASPVLARRDGKLRPRKPQTRLVASLPGAGAPAPARGADRTRNRVSAGSRVARVLHRRLEDSRWIHDRALQREAGGAGALLVAALRRRLARRVLGLLPRGVRYRDRGHLGQRLARPHRQPAGPVDEGQPMGRHGTPMVGQPSPLRSHPLSRGRCGGLRLG